MKKNLKKNRGKLRSEEAYDEIKNQIISLKLSPGVQLDEANLGKDLGMGRTPVREALLQLVAGQLVEMVPNRGFFVRHITLDDVRDLYETMLMLHRGSVSIAIRRMEPEQIEELQEINEELKKAWLKTEILKVTLLNSQFHRILNEATRNVFLQAYLNNLQDPSQRLAFLTYSKGKGDGQFTGHGQLSYDDHEALIQSLKKGDEEEAAGIMRRHIKVSHERVLKYVSELIEIDSTE